MALQRCFIALRFQNEKINGCQVIPITNFLINIIHNDNFRNIKIKKNHSIKEIFHFKQNST